DPNAFRAVVECHGAGQDDDGALGGGVGGEAARAERRNRRHVDDGAAARAPQGGDGVLGGQKHAVDVDGHQPAPVLFALVDDGAAAADADVVVEEVEAAEAVEGGLDHGGAVGGLGDVGLEGEGLAAAGLDHL